MILAGINVIVADFSYLQKNAHKIKGIFIGTPNFFNTKGLIVLLQVKSIHKHQLHERSRGLIIKKMFDNKANYKKIEPNVIVLEPIKDKQVGSLFVTAFKISNSLPHSYGFVLKTEDGAIVFVDEFYCFKRS